MTARPAALAIATLDALDEQACAAALAPLFEGAPRFLARLAAARPFEDAATLFARAREIAQAMPEPEQLELIDAHPRLGAPPASVSAMSFREQGYDADRAGGRPSGRDAVVDTAAAQVTAEEQRVDRELQRLNAAYEARFGFRYCAFVAGRPRAALLPGMAEALGADREAEIHRALDAVVDIAADRYRRLTGG